MLILMCVIQDVSSILSNDCQTLLELCLFANLLVQFGNNGQSFAPADLAEVPAHLVPPLWRKRRQIQSDISTFTLSVFFYLYEHKTEVILFSPKCSRSSLCAYLSTLIPHFKSVVPTFFFFHFGHLSKIISLLSRSHLESVMHLLVGLLQLSNRN
ncbi:hypothetical protein ATANTOWER_018176 [Ataeniobius toweri]|uniref:Uncharacterized protein n=1 Tax=Ataeniobius toweri TaxID=208326 RepID=A0ABU7B8M7_9TELE|nr:hypothetical protein [Ataeniobius toweri]